MNSNATGSTGRTDAIHALVRNVVDTRDEKRDYPPEPGSPDRGTDNMAI
jgi:hypothetical protein